MLKKQEKKQEKKEEKPKERVEKSILELTDSELDEKIEKLTKIVFSRNMNLAFQAKPLLMSLYDEQSRRNTVKFEEHLAKSGIKMDEIINIG
jgi:hypothetical protein